MKTYDITINGEPAVVDERRVVDALTHGDVRAFTTQADTCFAIAKSEDARDALVSIGGGSPVRYTDNGVAGEARPQWPSRWEVKLPSAFADLIRRLRTSEAVAA